MLVRNISLVTIVVLFQVLTACRQQLPVLAVEQAREVQAAFEETLFVPPPRTITDILVVFDSSNAAPAGFSDQEIKLAKGSPPSTSDTETLINFYNKRLLARLKLGLVQEALEDARISLGYYEQTENYQRRRLRSIRGDAARAEMTVGNYRNGIRQFKLDLADYRTMPRFAKLALAYAEGGDFDNAERIKLEADGLAKTLLLRSSTAGSVGGPTIVKTKIAQARMDSALHQLKGQWRKAEGRQRRVIQLLGLLPEKDSWESYYAKNTLAVILMRQGRLIESESVLRNIIHELIVEVGRNHLLVPQIARDLAMVLNRQGRFADSERLLNEVLKINASAGVPIDSSSSGIARFQLGKNLVSQRKWSDALEQFSRAHDDLVENAFLYERWLTSDISVPLALIKMGRAVDAEKILRKSLSRNIQSFTPNKYRIAEMRGALGMALAAMGKKKSALKSFQEAVPELIFHAVMADSKDEGDLARELRRIRILEDYIKLLTGISDTLLQDGSNAVEEAFRIDWNFRHVITGRIEWVDESPTQCARARCNALARGAEGRGRLGRANFGGE